MPDLKQLRDKYQLAPQPEEVEKISEIVKGREKASMDDLANVIKTNQVISQRMITMAFPKAAARKDATVQMATARLGINRVIMLLVGDLLTEAVHDTFEKMFNMKLEPDEPSILPLGNGSMVACVKFTGKASGEVHLGFSPHLCLLIAAHILEGNIEDDYPREVIIDAVGETVNIVTGNLQSRLSDAGLPAEIGLPEVFSTTTMPRSSIPDTTTETFMFKHGFHNLTVDLCLSPFSRQR